MDGQELTFPHSQVRHNGLRRPSGSSPAKDWPHLLLFFSEFYEMPHRKVGSLCQNFRGGFGRSYE